MPIQIFPDLIRVLVRFRPENSAARTSAVPSIGVGVGESRLGGQEASSVFFLYLIFSRCLASLGIRHRTKRCRCDHSNQHGHHKIRKVFLWFVVNLQTVSDTSRNTPTSWKKGNGQLRFWFLADGEVLRIFRSAPAIPLNLKMKAIKDWIACQLSSNPLLSSMPPSGDDSFLTDEPMDEFGNSGTLPIILLEIVFCFLYLFVFLHFSFNCVVTSAL